MIHPGIPLGVRDAGTQNLFKVFALKLGLRAGNIVVQVKLVSFVRSIKYQLTWPSQEMASLCVGSSRIVDCTLGLQLE